jgi:hypothetical protein
MMRLRNTERIRIIESILLWQIPVPPSLQNGERFDKWTEEKDSVDLEVDSFFRYCNSAETIS